MALFTTTEALPTMLHYSDLGPELQSSLKVKEDLIVIIIPR